MSVLPNTATFYSFFITCVGSTLITFFLGMVISTPKVLRPSAGVRHTIVTGFTEYFKRLKRLLDPSSKIHDEYEVPKSLPLETLHVIFRLPALVVIQSVLVPAILLPERLWRMWELRNNPYWSMTWDLGFFLGDGVRLWLCPVALGWILCLLLYLVTLDVLIWVIAMLWKVGMILWNALSDRTE